MKIETENVPKLFEIRGTLRYQCLRDRELAYLIVLACCSSCVSHLILISLHVVFLAPGVRGIEMTLWGNTALAN